MIKTDGSVISNIEGITTEEKLLVYNEEEKQRNEINAANAKLVFNWKYLVVPREIFDLGLSGNEAILFSFVHTFLNSTDRFYFSNEQLSSMFNMSENSITNILTKLKDRGLIVISHRRHAAGGQIRFVSLPNHKNWDYQIPKIVISKSQKLGGNNNKINDNKINTQGDEKKILVKKITEWAYTRAATKPSILEEMFVTIIAAAIQRHGEERIRKLYSMEDNAITFLVKLKRLDSR